MQTVGNLCLSLAALLYLFPLQYLALEMSRKKDDGGGAIAGIIILAPMWLLLLAGLLIATSRGGFDVLPLKRGAIYPLVIGGTLALAVLTFISLNALWRPTWGVRLLLGWEFLLIPLLTLIIAASALHPGLGDRLPLGGLRWMWIGLAALSLAGGVAYLGYAGVRAGARQVRAVAHGLGSDRALETEHLAKVGSLDPQRDFSGLLGYTTHFYSDEVRALAVARLRTHLALAEAVMPDLQASDPLKALEFLSRVELTAAERTRLAGPVRDAMFALADRVHRELRYTPPRRLKYMRRLGGETCRALASQFSGYGIDFAPALDAFERAFIPDDL